MSEVGYRKASNWWTLSAAIIGCVLLFAGMVWLYLPDIVALGLRYKCTRNVSKSMLVGLGPRAVCQVFEQHRFFNAKEWLGSVRTMCDSAEASASQRTALICSLKDPDSNGPNKWTLLHIAVGQGARELMLALIESGAEIDARDRDGWTPLHWAAGKNQPSLAALLVSAGADMNASATGGWTPLHSAVNSRSVAVIRILASRGADLDAKNNNGNTPLHSAAVAGHVDMAEVLLHAGAGICVRNYKGMTPLNCAIKYERREVAELLRRHGAKTRRELDAENAGPCRDSASPVK